MAWVQIIDDGVGSTPQPYTDTQGHMTSMTVTSSNGPNSAAYNAALNNSWTIGDNSQTAAETHTHTFTEPVNVLRVDVNYLDNGDFANFAYIDDNGDVFNINVAQWVANGDAVLTLGAGHRNTNLPANGNINGIRGSNGVAGQPGGTTTIEFKFPTPASQFIVGKNSISGQSIRDAYAYRLYYDDVLSVVCFANGTLIETEVGLVTIESLKTGDMIKTRDNGFQPLRWVGSRKMQQGELNANANLRPIRIKAGALGPNVPTQDLTVSPQHRILVRSDIAHQMFNTDEVLVAAKHLLELPGIDIAEDMETVEYFHILFDRHEVIYANGAEAESLFTGKEAMKSLSAADRKEIFAIFPELESAGIVDGRNPARPFLNGRMGRQLAGELSKSEDRFDHHS